MRRKDADNNRMYKDMVDHAVGRLMDHGQVSKTAICDDSGYPGMEDGLDWRIIREMINDSLKELVPDGVDVWPVTAKLFQHKRLHADNLKQYVCLGHGKRCAGFVIATVENGKLVQRILEIRRNQIAGAAKVFNGQQDRAATACGIETTIPAPLLIEEHRTEA